MSDNLLARNIRTARAIRKMSMAEMGKETGLSKGTISRLENGKEPDLPTLHTIAKFLNITMDQAYTCLRVPMEPVEKKYG